MTPQLDALDRALIAMLREVARDRADRRRKLAVIDGGGGAMGEEHMGDALANLASHADEPLDPVATPLRDRMRDIMNAHKLGVSEGRLIDVNDPASMVPLGPSEPPTE